MKMTSLPFSLFPCDTRVYLWEVNFADRLFFFILRKLILTNVKHWFILLGINIRDFQKVTNIYNLLLNCMESTGETTKRDVKTRQLVSLLIALVG